MAAACWFRAFQHATPLGLRFSARCGLRPTLVSISAFSAVRLMPAHVLRDGFRAEALTSAGQLGVAPSLLTTPILAMVDPGKKSRETAPQKTKKLKC